MVEAGEPAPDATFTSEDGEEIQLSDYEGEGNVLLAFYPFAFSSVCTSELEGFRDHYDEFKSLDTEVFGVSTDSHFTQAAFSDELGLPFELLSDWDRTEARKFDAFFEEPGHTKRVLTLVDEDGNVAWHKEFEPSTCPDAEQVLGEIKRNLG